MLISGSTIRPPFGSRASASNIRSTSAGSHTAALIDATERFGAAASTGPRNRSANGALCGLNMSKTRVTCGAVCLSASSHLVPIENSKLVEPVRLPPGCARFGTRPWPTGSLTCANTIGTVRLCFCSAAVTGVVLAKIRSGSMASSSATWSRNPFPSLDPPQLPQAVFEYGHARMRLWVVGDKTHQHTDPSHPLRMPRVCGERPCGGAAEQRDELAPSDVTCHAPLPRRRGSVRAYTQT